MNNVNVRKVQQEKLLTKYPGCSEGEIFGGIKGGCEKESALDLGLKKQI